MGAGSPSTFWSFRPKLLNSLLAITLFSLSDAVLDSQKKVLQHSIGNPNCRFEAKI